MGLNPEASALPVSSIAHPFPSNACCGIALCWMMPITHSCLCPYPNAQPEAQGLKSCVCRHPHKLMHLRAGDALYGLAPVLAALASGRRTVHALYVQEGGRSKSHKLNCPLTAFSALSAHPDITMAVCDHWQST